MNEWERRGDKHARWRQRNIPTIKAFCEDLGLNFSYVNGYEWHIRIEGIMDVYPTRNRYHLIRTGERGSFEDYEKLGDVFSRYVTELKEVHV